MPCGRATVVTLSYCMKGVIRWAIPIDSDFPFIMCHTLVGDRNGAIISRCIRERGDMENIVTLNLSGLGVALDNLGVLGGSQDNIASMSSSRITSLSPSSRNSRSITIEASIWLRRMSLKNARTFLSSGNGVTEDGVTN